MDEVIYMQKKFRFLFIGLIMIFICSFVSCTTVVTPRPSDEPRQLDAPEFVRVVELENSFLIGFDYVPNSSRYQILIKDLSGNLVHYEKVSEDYNQIVIAKDKLESGDYLISVIAEGDEVLYFTSEESEQVSLKVVKSDPTPTPTPTPTPPVVYPTLTAYYSSAQDLVGTQLKAKLRNIITSTHKKQTTYNDCKKYLPNADEDPNNSNNMILFYTGESIKKSTDLTNDWNREHVWCQSLGWFTTSGAGADLHHIRPCSIKVNSSRGNKIFGTGSGMYEPADNYKGDVARIIFYLLIRYTESDAEIYGFTGKNKIAQSLELLLAWNELDPVDILEQNRNEYIYKIQGNRNPFIDYPEFADMIWA